MLPVLLLAPSDLRFPRLLVAWCLISPTLSLTLTTPLQAVPSLITSPHYNNRGQIQVLLGLWLIKARRNLRETLGVNHLEEYENLIPFNDTSLVFTSYLITLKRKALTNSTLGNYC